MYSPKHGLLQSDFQLPCKREANTFEKENSKHDHVSTWLVPVDDLREPVDLSKGNKVMA